MEIAGKRSLRISRILSVLFSFSVSGVFFVAGAKGVLAEEEADGGAETLKLTAEIEHAQELEPLSPALEAGSTFNQAAIEKRFTPTDYWYRIPNWLGGIWQRNEQNMLRQKSLTLSDKLKSSFIAAPRLGLFKSQVVYRWGHQYDRLGQIWNYVQFPYTSQIQGSSFYTVQVVRSAVPIKVNEKIVILKFRDSSHRVDYRTNQILSSQQSESISMYSLYKPHVIYARFSRKEFNSDGKAKFIQESESYIPRVKSFYPQNFKDGKDLRLSLRHYLHTH